MAEANPSRLETYAKLTQVVSVVIGVVISVVTIGFTLHKEADTRRIEAQKLADQREAEAHARTIEAIKPFLQLRQTYYLEAIKAAAVLASPLDHTREQIGQAKRRFWELYWAELALVDTQNVASTMKGVGDVADLRKPTPLQEATADFAHALRDSLLQSWGIPQPSTLEAGDATQGKIGQLREGGQKPETGQQHK
jgi:hypothetical protein